MFKNLFSFFIAGCLFLISSANAQDKILKINEVISFKVKANQPFNRPGIILMKGHAYEISATGKWKNDSCDSSDASGFLASECGSPMPGVDILMSATEGLRRDKDHRWFCLTGELFNQQSNSFDNKLADQQFSIGRSARVLPSASGKLVLFANDIMTGYDNNKGQVTVTIKRTQ